MRASRHLCQGYANINFVQHFIADLCAWNRKRVQTGIAATGWNKRDTGQGNENGGNEGEGQ